MKRLLQYFFLMGAVILSIPLPASDTIRNFTLGHVKIPIYQKGKLDFIIFAENGRRNGELISGKNTLIDRLLKTADVDRIPDGWQTSIYPLRSPLPRILKFWEKRYNSSEAVLFTSQCTFDRNRNVIDGNSEVMMRTPAFDLDGIGFRADLNKKEIEIRSDVEIIARRDDSDPRGILSGKQKVPAITRTVSATGDSLRLDMLHNEIMLIGNVKVVDGATTLNCDRLTVFLKGENDKVEKKKDSGNDFGDSTAMLKGISRILADGDVLLKRRPENIRSGNAAQYARAEQLEYEFDSGRIILTGEDELPSLNQDNYTLCGKRIELLRFSRKAFVKGSCTVTEFTGTGEKRLPLRTITADQADFDGIANLNIFTGNVQVNDNDAVLKCHRMRIFLKPVAQQSDSGRKNQEFTPLSGIQDLDRIFCDGNVSIVSKPKNTAAGKKAKKQLPSTLNAQRAELDYPADKLVFYNNVRINHQGDMLNCDRLDLFLKDSAFSKKSGKTTASGGVALGGRGANDKTLSKVIASGKVSMKDQQSDLSTELLTLDFRELAPGTVKTPGMFAASDVQLTRIACDGKVVATSLPGAGKDAAQKRILKAEHAMSDLLKNQSEFHKNVSIHEENNTLSCRDMFVFTGAAPAIAAAPEPSAAPVKPEDDPDADPFALEPTENTAPSRIALADGVDLERIVCKNQVLLTNKDKKGAVTYAGGDSAVYTVKTGDITITADAPNRPYLKRDGRIQVSDIIQGNLITEELSGSGNVQVISDKSSSGDSK